VRARVTAKEDIMRQTTPKLTTARYADRFEAETARQQRRYCDAFETWRRCGQSACQRNRTCRGDQRAYLKRALGVAPREQQRQARLDILAATPKNIGGPERAVRLLMPCDFYDGTADRYVIQELKRLRKSGKIVQGGDNVHTLRLRLVDAGR
jgi:hypothetical protein